MKDLALNTETNDLDFKNGDIYFVEDADCVAQFVRQRINTIAGEWFLDITEGIPYFTDILVKNPNIIVIDSLLKNVILNTAGVLELLSFELGYDSSLRTLSVTCEIRAESGTIEIYEEITA